MSHNSKWSRQKAKEDSGRQIKPGPKTVLTEIRTDTAAHSRPAAALAPWSTASAPAGYKGPRRLRLAAVQPSPGCRHTAEGTEPGLELVVWVESSSFGGRMMLVRHRFQLKIYGFVGCYFSRARSNWREPKRKQFYCCGSCCFNSFFRE